MTLTFTSSLDGKDIHCEIGSDAALAAPVFCFSIQAPARIEAGGKIIRRVGGYTEIQLPDIAANGLAKLTIGYEDPYFQPANRAWLPLGGYLRLADGACVSLPKQFLGVRAPKTEPAALACDGLRLVPPPSVWTPTGTTLTTTSFATDHPMANPVAALAQRLNFAPIITPEGTPLSVRSDPTLPAEGYMMSIGAERVTLSAATDTGVFYGLITLLNLVQTHDGILPCGTITDTPRFGWRGQHMDCARHFFQTETLLRLLDMMALLKMNRFHWHFADDEAFRLETTTAPDLWQRSAYCGERRDIPGVFGGGIRSGGSYGTDDVAAVLARAQEMQIEVLPEIEMPAHALCLNAILPGLRDPEDTGTEASVQGYVGNTVNPAMPETWKVIEPLASEVAAMFPLGILHLGGDELPPNTWDGSPAADALKAREGLETRDDLQGWTMARLAAHLAPQGIRSAAWEEAARGSQGGIGHDALIFSWTGQGAGIEAARQGHEVVMCPAQHVYLDMAHTNDPDDWGANWAAYVALEDVVDWSPVPDDAPDIADKVIGVEGTFWCEFTCVDAEMEPMLAPRILGVACKGWESDGQTDGRRLRALAGAYGPLFDRMKWARHRGA